MKFKRGFLSAPSLSAAIFAALFSAHVVAGAPASAPAATDTQSHSDEPHWGYTGSDSAEKWGDLDKSFATCKSGKEQSPIDIKTKDVKKAKLDKIEFNYAPTKLVIANIGHTVQVNYDKGSYIKVGGKQYDLVQFHFHTPSEEEIDGKESDLVVHLVHKSSDGSLAVVAVLFNRGAENAFLKTFWEKLPRDNGETINLSKLSIKAADMLPADKTYYSFKGSLTTPPCSENVSWFVLKNPVTISKEQVTAFRRIYPMNNRPVQPINARTVTEGG